jgi:hypothetical protein
MTDQQPPDVFASFAVLVYPDVENSGWTIDVRRAGGGDLVAAASVPHRDDIVPVALALLAPVMRRELEDD